MVSKKDYIFAWKASLFTWKICWYAFLINCIYTDQEYQPTESETYIQGERDPHWEHISDECGLPK